VATAIINCTDSFENRILRVLQKHNYIPSPAVHLKLVYDIETHGADIVKLAFTFSPSQLGRMGLLGVRRLAQLKRDDPKLFEQLMNEFLKLLEES